MDKLETVLNGLKLNADNMFYFHVNTRTKELILFDCGYEKFSTTEKRISNNYPYYLFHCVLSGKGFLRLANRTFDVRAGQIFVIPPGEDVVYYQDVTDPWEYIWINVGGTNIASYYQNAGFSASSPVYTFSNSELTEQFAEMLASYKLKFGSQPNIFAHFYKMLSLLVEERSQNVIYVKRKTDEYMNNILAFLESNYPDPALSLEAACEILHLNPNYFSRLFHKSLGCTFSEYVNLLRVRKASDLLTTTNLNVRQISQAVGFSDPLYFSRVFKKYRLVSPKEYKSKRS